MKPTTDDIVPARESDRADERDCRFGERASAVRLRLVRCTGVALRLVGCGGIERHAHAPAIG